MTTEGIEHIVTRAHDVPGVRKHLPAPFMRPSIDLDGTTRVKRSWRDIKVLDVQRGDVVAFFGKIEAAVEITKVPTAVQIRDEGQPVVWMMRLHNVQGEYRDYPAEQRLYVFCPDKQ